MLEYYKNYTILAINYTLKNLKKIISVLEIDKIYRYNNTK